jgi:nucleotide-binding universal stress UspA family protein
MSTHVLTSLFDRVVCGVDDSDAGLTAARVAGLVTAIGGRLTLVSANDPTIAVHAGWGMSQLLEELADDAARALERGRLEAEPFHPLDTKLLRGNPLRVLLAEIVKQEATTIVVGSHGLSRAGGIALGAVSTHLLHEAPCAVLIARGPIDPERWPRRIVVGVDGSECSARAVEAASALGERFGAKVRAVVATGGGKVDLAEARRIAPGCEEHEARSFDALSVLSERTELLVLGSRGLRGLRAVGSLSERLAHEAGCSVLVVRPPA